MVSQTEQLNGAGNQENLLLQTVLRLFAAPVMLEQIRQASAEHGEKLSQIQKILCLHENSLRELGDLHQKQSQALEAFYQRQNCLDEASRQQTILSQQHFDRHVIEPLARRIISLIDMLAESGSICQNDPFCNSRLEAFEAFKAELLDLLASYGIEPLEVSIGSRFDAKIMQPSVFYSTVQSDKNMTVKTIVRPGFRHENRILRPSKVDLYRFNGVQAITQQPQKKGA